MTNSKHVSNAMMRLIRGREAAKQAAKLALDTIVTKAQAKAPSTAAAVARRVIALPIPTDDTRPNA